MNKGLFRLVFSVCLNMFVPAPEFVRSCRGGSSSVARRHRRALAALLIAAFASYTPAVVAATPAGLQPGTQTTSGTGSWVGAKIASSSADQMTILQQQAKAILDWKQLNLLRGQTLTFDQQGNRSWAALNRIHDANPSTISGNLKADGHIYFINTNGIIFGDGAQINVGSLTASSLDLAPDLFNAGILSDPSQPVFSGSGFVRVEQGAAITAATGGRVMLLGKNVTNSGVILTPEGQTILAAGETVYLAKSTDPAGLLVEVDAGGTALNLGEIIARRGNVTLVGLAVNQQGVITASTSVRAKGSIRLLARDTVTKGTTDAQPFFATQAGTVTLGGESITSVEVEVLDKEEVLDQQNFMPSEVLLSGKKIDIEGSIIAHGGNVTATDVLSNSSLQPPRGSVGALINLGEHALIDVSGIDATGIPMARNQLEIQLFSEQLKNAPLLRGGPLFGETIYVDARNGTPLTDIAPYTNLIGRTVAEKMSSGGTVNLTANAGNVVLREGSRIDVSGGSIAYEAGVIKESSLRYNGQLIPIADATPDKIYQGTAETYSVTDPKWGVTRTWTLASSPQGTYQQAYTAGSAAGNLNILANTAVLDGTLVANTRPSYLQREVPLPGGALAINVRNSIRVLQDAQKLPGDFTFDVPLPAQQSKETQLDVEYLGAGFTELELTATNTIADGNNTTPGNITVDAAMQTDAAGKLTLSAAGTINVNQDIVAPGGTVSLDANNIVLADDVIVSTSGLWTNDTPNVDSLQTVPPVAKTSPIAKDGGTLSVIAKDGFAMGQNSLLDASAGAWLTANGKLQGGKGGDITLDASGGLATLSDVQGKVQSYGYTQGGELNLSTQQDIQVGGQRPTSGNALWLPESFFEQGGFSKYNVKAAGANSSVVVGDSNGSDSVIHPRMQTLVALKNAAAQISGSALNKVATPVLLAQHLRTPASVSFSSTGGDVTVLSNTTIKTDAPISRTGTVGTISLESTSGQISILGDLFAPDGKLIAPGGKLITPGGTISAEISGLIAGNQYDNTRSIFVGEGAVLSVAGQYLQPPTLAGSLSQEEVLNGGEIILDGGDLGAVVLQEGSKLDVSGASGDVNIKGSSGVTRETMHSAAGSITLSSRNALVLDGDLIGKATGTGAGGTLTLNITGKESNAADAGGAHPSDARALTITQNKVIRGSDLTAGGALDSVIGSGAISAQITLDTDIDTDSDGDIDIIGGGFDRLNVSVQGVANDRIVLSTEVSDLNKVGNLILELPTALVLDAGVLEVTGSGIAKVGAAHTTLSGLGSNDAPAPPGGDATLLVNADFIDLIGSQVVTGVKSTSLSAQQDIRGRGFDVGVLGPVSLKVPGELELSARQVYPVTNSAYSFEATGTGSKITVKSRGAPTPVLSAGASLTLKADKIIQGGVLRAPLGQITLDAATELTLEPGSLTSVSAEGQLIPYGLTGLGGLNWVVPQGQLLASDGNVLTALPEKKITLKSAVVDLETGAKVDISGGGDVLAYEWIDGIGGSTDILGQTGVYAVMPTMKGEYAPFDHSYNKIIDPDITNNPKGSTTITINTDLKPGDAVYLSGIPGLAAGSYTLLPARYALLPGAFMVDTRTDGTLARGQSVGQADGSTLVAGYRTTVADSATNADTHWDTFKITDGSIFRPAAGTISKAPAEYRLSTGNQFFQNLALDSGLVAVPRLASDAGQLVLDARQELTLGGEFIATKDDGARGALVDITSDKISVVSAIDNAASGTLQLTTEALNGLNAESLLLGGVRKQSGKDENGKDVIVDGMEITTNATQVTFANDTDHALQVTELVAVAKDTLTVNSGATIQTLATTQPAGITKLRATGDGALLAVSALNELVLDRTGTSDAPTLGTLDIQEKILDKTTIHAHRSLALDSTNSTQAAKLEGTITVDDGGSATLGANRILLGAPDGTVVGTRIETLL